MFRSEHCEQESPVGAGAQHLLQNVAAAVGGIKLSNVSEQIVFSRLFT